MIDKKKHKTQRQKKFFFIYFYSLNKFEIFIPKLFIIQVLFTFANRTFDI